MSEAGRIWQFIGTFLPLYGVVLTIAAAVWLRGVGRAAAVVLVPLLTLGLCATYGERIAYDGNMLYVVLVLLYILALCVYYPVLLAIGVRRFMRKPFIDDN